MIGYEDNVNYYKCSCPNCGTPLIEATSIKNGILKCFKCSIYINVSVSENGECKIQIVKKKNKKTKMIKNI